MRLTWIAAAAAAATGMAVPAIAGGEWPDGPNKLWFEGLQRPDNHLNPSRKIDQKSLFCCGIADTVKTKFKVEPGDERYPEDRWYAWLKDDWVLVPSEKIVPDFAPDGQALSVSARRHHSVLCATERRALTMRAALLLAVFLSPTVALAGDDAWPDSPNKLWFENLQRPDNHKRPYQDKHTKSCCGPGDVVKTKFRVVPR